MVVIPITTLPPNGCHDKRCRQLSLPARTQPSNANVMADLTRLSILQPRRLQCRDAADDRRVGADSTSSWMMTRPTCGIFMALRAGHITKTVRPSVRLNDDDAIADPAWVIAAPAPMLQSRRSASGPDHGLAWRFLTPTARINHTPGRSGRGFHPRGRMRISTIATPTASNEDGRIASGNNAGRP